VNIQPQPDFNRANKAYYHYTDHLHTQALQQTSSTLLFTPHHTTLPKHEMSSFEKYHITEPHPSVPKSHWIHAGRGGAGNITHVNPKKITSGPDASGPASVTAIKPHAPTSLFVSGRGGAGNIHQEKERAIFSFDEELQQQQRLMEHQAPVYHIGRGGAGNLIHDGERRRGSGSSASSASSTASAPRVSLEGALNKIRGSFSRH
jgi:Protein of unknown function (DUF3602)